MIMLHYDNNNNNKKDKDKDNDWAGGKARRQLAWSIIEKIFCQIHSKVIGFIHLSLYRVFARACRLAFLRLRNAGSRSKIPLALNRDRSIARDPNWVTNDDLDDAKTSTEATVTIRLNVSEPIVEMVWFSWAH